MPGLLSVVATPIGNLEDVTLRSLRVLREANLIAAEDTRHTAKLLRHFGRATPTISFHAHTLKSRLPQLLQKLAEGQHLALVSDAGTPGVSDPGVELVDACRQAGIRVEPIPGASAHLPVDAHAGHSVARVRHTFTFFEAPHRISACLVESRTYFGVRPIVVTRELTKAHEETVVLLPVNAGEMTHELVETSHA